MCSWILQHLLHPSIFGTALCLDQLRPVLFIRLCKSVVSGSGLDTCLFFYSFSKGLWEIDIASRSDEIQIQETFYWSHVILTTFCVRPFPLSPSGRLTGFPKFAKSCEKPFSLLSTGFYVPRCRVGLMEWQFFIHWKSILIFAAYIQTETVREKTVSMLANCNGAAVFHIQVGENGETN